MKVCLIGPIPPFRGGVSKYCYSLARELEARHELLLLSYRRQYPALLYGNKPQLDAAYDRKAMAEEFRHVSYDIDSLQLSSWMSTARRIDSFFPDLVILPWWVTYWTPMYVWMMRHMKRRGIKCLLLCINVYEHEDSLIKKILTQFVLKHADTMLVHSKQELAEAQALNDRAAIVEHPLPVFRYGGSTSPRSTGSSLHLLFFGFVRPYKGLDMLLRAMVLVTGLDVKLKAVGEFWRGKKEYLGLIRELGISDKVEVVDCYVSDEEMARYFAWADVVVLPYREARTSGVIATAYGYGIPVLATDVGGFGEVVVDGHTGRLIPAHDTQAIADGIRWFYGNRQVDFKENIRSFVEQQMSWRSLVDTIEQMVAHTD